MRDALLGAPPKQADVVSPPRRRVKQAVAVAPTKKPSGRKVRPKAAEKYAEVTRLMLHRYEVRVKRWRNSMSGLAFLVQYRDGTVARLIESPRPKSPMSVAIFLHEIGHHAIGLGIHKPRCLEEYLAWKFSLETMEQLGLPVTDRVRRRVDRSLRYAVRKARRRGIKTLPSELMPYDG
ncbi:MAG: hypothetical protein JSR77_07380 [Planctomycetes bacterium]|nr:hypothetical protein [Planctomycetota bacterium]